MLIPKADEYWRVSLDFIGTKERYVTIESIDAFSVRFRVDDCQLVYEFPLKQVRFLERIYE